MKLGIYGAGGLGREVAETANNQKIWEEIIYIDDYNNNDYLDGFKRLSFDDFCKVYSRECVRLVCAVGDPKHKKDLYDRVTSRGYSLANIIHDRCSVSKSASLGNGVILRSGVVVSVDVVIGNNVTIMENSYIGHGNTISDNVQISSNVSTGGNVTIGKESFVGAGACIKERVSIGENSIIGIGTTVVNNVDKGTICYNKLDTVRRSYSFDNIF